MKQVPLAFVFMSKRSKKAYKAVFNALLDLVPQCKLKTIVTDFEAATWNAAREVFPNIVMRGCLFHFNQAVFRKIKEFKLDNEYDNEPHTHRFCRQLMALPLLPKEHIVGAFNRITKYVVEAAGLPKHKKLVNYMRSTWIDSNQFPPSSWCWFREAIRTNNDVEGWHTRLIKNAETGNQPFYKLITLLGSEAQVVELHCVLVKQHRLTRKQRKSTVESTVDLIELWDRYADKLIQWQKLLEKASELIQPSKTWR